MTRPIQLGDFGWLTDAKGNFILADHGAKIPVATDVFTGTRYQKVCTETPGVNAVQQQDAVARLSASGAVHVQSENSQLRGWWEPVAPTPAVIEPPQE